MSGCQIGLKPVFASLGGLSNIIKTDYFSNFGAKVLDEGVHEFNMIDNYMFAVVPVSRIHCLSCYNLVLLERCTGNTEVMGLNPVEAT